MKQNFNCSVLNSKSLFNAMQELSFLFCFEEFILVELFNHVDLGYIWIPMLVAVQRIPTQHKKHKQGIDDIYLHIFIPGQTMIECSESSLQIKPNLPS